MRALMVWKKAWEEKNVNLYYVNLRIVSKCTGALMTMAVEMPEFSILS